VSDSDVREPFGALLRRQRLAISLTQEQLAECSGVAKRTIQDLERGVARPRRETARQLIGALNLSPEARTVFEAVRPSRRPRVAHSPSHEPRAQPVGTGTTAQRHHGNLPVPRTRLIGREQAVAAVRQLLLRDDVGLVTLTGPPGTGKTRLSLQVAADVLDRFEDGACFVELAPISDPALVPSTIAQTVGVRDVVGRPLLDVLLDALRDRQLLLVLDNFEQILPAAAVVDALLQACPRLTVLVTSRAALQLRGEHEYPVPPLALPDSEQPITPDTLSKYGAVALFVERATAITPDFVLTNANAPTVAEICARLDGLPLAIELATARIRLLPPEAMLPRLGHGLDLLAGGRRDLPARQQALRNTISWSYDLLSEAEQRLFRCLGVFVGGFTLDAAESVCKVEGDLGIDVLDGLESLVSKSLVKQQADAAGDPRFTMLETIREYALEQLQASGERELLQRRHAAVYVGLAEEARPHFAAFDQVRWLDRVERDRDNLHTALRWAIEREDAELGMRLAWSLAIFWYWRGYHSEGLTLQGAVLALPAGPELAGLRARLTQGIGFLAVRQGDYPTARALIEESLASARRQDDRELLAGILVGYGRVTRQIGDIAAAQPVLQECLVLSRELGLTRYVAEALLNLGVIALDADRDIDAAWALSEESLALYRGLGNRRMAGTLLRTMGRIARLRGDTSSARAFVGESLVAFGEVGDYGEVPSVLNVLAALDADGGQLERAVRLVAAAATLADRMGIQMIPAFLRERDAWLEPARAALGTDAFAAAWTEGQAMTQEQAVAYALEGPAPS
jgi:predicted ATPase/DNA-binding XRE family transcriptional regulator